MAVTVVPHARILQAATGLIESGGLSAVTTRAVAAAAGLQPNAIYRIFGDMPGLLDAVALHGLAQYLKDRPVPPTDGDPVYALRAGRDAHVEFGRQPRRYLPVDVCAVDHGPISEAAKTDFDKFSCTALAVNLTALLCWANSSGLIVACFR